MGVIVTVGLDLNNGTTYLLAINPRNAIKATKTLMNKLNAPQGSRLKFFAIQSIIS